MQKFVTVHASGDDGSQWQFPDKNDGYVPRVYFLNAAGEFVKVRAPNPDYDFFLSSADAVTGTNWG